MTPQLGMALFNPAMLHVCRGSLRNGLEQDGTVRTQRDNDSESFRRGFDCRRFQAEKPAAFKAPPSENGAAPAFSGPNPVFGTKKGPNRRRKRHEHDCPGRASMGCAVGDWAFWLWGGVSLNTPRPGGPSRRGQPRTCRGQANTSSAKVLRSSPAQSTRALRSFLVSCLAAAWGATLASSSPAWGSLAGGAQRRLRSRREEEDGQVLSRSLRTRAP